MLKILKAPYPLYLLSTRRFLFIIGIGAFVSFFLYFFQPFGTAQASFPNKTAFLLGYGAVISGSLIILEFIATKLFFQKVKEESWTILKQISWIIVYTTGALIACYAYKQWFFQIPFDLLDFFYFYRIALSIAIFPIVIIILVDYIYQLQKNQSAAAKINDQVQTLSQNQEAPTKELQLLAENGKDQFSLPPKNILFLQAADNYVEIHYQNEGDGNKKEILRGSLQRMEKQIEAQSVSSKLIRCHRSFLVNLDQVSSVSGNAQGYKLHLHEHPETVPVSRTKSKTVLALLKS